MQSYKEKCLFHLIIKGLNFRLKKDSKLWWPKTTSPLTGFKIKQQSIRSWIIFRLKWNKTMLLSLKMKEKLYKLGLLYHCIKGSLWGWQLGQPPRPHVWGKPRNRRFMVQYKPYIYSSWPHVWYSLRALRTAKAAYDYTLYGNWTALEG